MSCGSVKLSPQKLTISFLLKNQNDTNGFSDNMIESSNSSFYSSFLKTEGSSGEEKTDQENRPSNTRAEEVIHLFP